MLVTPNSWMPYVVASALAVSVLSLFIWYKRKNYKRVGKISKLFFYPVKSLKAVEVTKGKCTKYGFEVNGLLDRAFMIINKDGVLVSQREAPSLALLTPHISENYLIISGPTSTLKVEIKKLPSPSDKRIECRVHVDTVKGTDCGEEAAAWFQSYLNVEGVRLVRFFHTEYNRTYTKNVSFFNKLRRKYPAGFQDLGAIHLLSQASVDDLNSRLEETKISVYNFRPNILAEDCEAYAEDLWKYIKINDKVELDRLTLTGRCILTTNDPDTGILSKKEPLVSLRKYRIAAEGQLSKLYPYVPFFGTTCAVTEPGEIEVGDEIFAIEEEMGKMKEKAA